MRLDQLENIEHLDEAPLGFMRKQGLKLKSKLPGGGADIAKGQLQVGDVANKLKSEYLQFVGQNARQYGKKPTTDTLLAFLQRKGIDTKEIAGIIDKELQALQPKAPPERQEPTFNEPNNVIQFQPNQKISWTSKKDGQTKTAIVVDPEKGPGGQPNSITVKGKGGTFPIPKNAPDLKVANEDIERYRKNFERIDWTLKEDQEYFKALEFMGVMEAEIPDKVLDKIMDIAAAKTTTGMSPKQEPETDQGQDQQGGDEKKGPGLFKTIGKAIGGVVGKAAGGVKAGITDPDSADTSKIFPGDDEEGGEMKGSLNYQNIAKEFPNLDAQTLRRSMSKSLQGKGLTKTEHETMSAALTQLLKKDPQDTVKVMNLFKQAKEV